jgi:hypothetical protein
VWSLGASAISTEATGDLDGALPAGDVARTVTNVSPQTAAALEELLPFYMRLAAERGDDPQIRRQAASAMHRIGLIQAKVGRFEEARSVWTREAALLAELASEQPAAVGEFALAAVLDADRGPGTREPHPRCEGRRARWISLKMDAAHSFECDAVGAPPALRECIMRNTSTWGRKVRAVGANDSDRRASKGRLALTARPVWEI